MQIGRRLIGQGHPPMLVAEMSGNHGGSLERALAIVHAAAEHGADAIKLQTFTPGTLTVRSDRPEFRINDLASPWHGRRLWDLYDEAHTPWEWHDSIFTEARTRGLACISTAFDESSVRFLQGLKVDAIKIASFEVVHLPLIEVAAAAGLPLIMSTGMASVEEITDAVAAARARGCDRLVLLKCTSAYPASEGAANLLTMSDMRARFGCDVGFSDHTLRPFAALAATALGAVIVEKHLTLSRADGGVDSGFSIEPNELGELARGMDLVCRSLGTVSYGAGPSEAASRLERPSIYVVRPIRSGEVFTADHVRVIRPAGGLPPSALRDVLGRKARRDINDLTPLAWDLVDSAHEA